jgi:hypothetical protein
LPIGFSGSRRPARASLMAEDSASIALSWPKTTRFRLASMCANTSASSLDTDFGGMRAIVAMVASMSLMPIVFLRRPSGSSFCDAPDSSITSIALSGSLRSLM